MRFFACNESRRKRKVGRFILVTIVCLCLICFVNFIPTFNLETSNMSLLEGKWVNVYERTKRCGWGCVSICRCWNGGCWKLGFDKKQNINIYIYDHQSTMQKKKYGYIGPLGLDWYIGDNIGTDVILTSPTIRKVHDYDITNMLFSWNCTWYISEKLIFICGWPKEWLYIWAMAGFYKVFRRRQFRHMKICRIY